MSFVHLHVHSHYSLLDGASRVEDLVTQAKALGMSALAISLLDEEEAITELCEDAWCDYQALSTRPWPVEVRDEILVAYEALIAAFPERFEFLDAGVA